MLYLRNVLELVDDHFNDRTLACKQLVRQAHQIVLQVAPRFGKKLNIERFKQLFGQLLRDVTSISKNFTAEDAEQIHHGFAVVGSTKRRSLTMPGSPSFLALL